MNFKMIMKVDLELCEAKIYYPVNEIITAILFALKQTAKITYLPSWFILLLVFDDLHKKNELLKHASLLSVF